MTFLDSLFCPSPTITPAQGAIILNQLEKIMATLADIQAAVAAETSVIQAVVTLLDSVEQQLKDAIAANDPAAMQTVVDSINANKSALAAAVAANTPSAPVTPPSPTTPATDSTNQP